MFQNSYQNGTYFDLFDPKTSQDKLKPLYRTTNITGNNKVFDKDLKTFVLEFTAPNSKMHLPRDDKSSLYLIQQYLVLQIYLTSGMPWNIELVISDLTKTKRRVMLSPTTGKTEIKPFFIKTACKGYREGQWNNLVVDLYSYMEAFKGQTYRCLDSIVLTGHFKLRRIYSTTCQLAEDDGQGEQEYKEIAFLPKQFYFPLGLPQATRLNRYEQTSQNHSQATSEQTDAASKSTINKPPQPPKPRTTGRTETKPQSAKQKGIIKQSEEKREKPQMKEKVEVSQRGKMEVREVKNPKEIKGGKEKVEVKQREKIEVVPKKIKDFLSNTNGDLLRRGRKEEKSESESSQVIQQGQPKTAKSMEKYGKKKHLIKTQHIAPKARSSLDKGNVAENNLNADKAKTKAKLNPWRNNVREQGTDISQLEISKQEEERNLGTPQTVSLFKTNLAKQPIAHKFDHGSEHYSDSEYVELSQKFTTLTDGKFFRQTQLQTPQVDPRDEQDEIEQNIEMESNSMYSSHRREDLPKQQQILESICDSLDPPEPERPKEEMGRSSLYGFGERLMRRFMGEVERPYSPPMGERQGTEQETEREEREKEEVELIYDPVLNCYYDHRTHTYYELKN